MAEPMKLSDLSQAELLKAIAYKMEVCDQSGNLMPQVERLLNPPEEGPGFTFTEWKMRHSTADAAAKLSDDDPLMVMVADLETEFERAQSCEMEGLPPPGDDPSAVVAVRLAEAKARLTERESIVKSTAEAHHAQIKQADEQARAAAREESKAARAEAKGK